MELPSTLLYAALPAIVIFTNTVISSVQAVVQSVETTEVVSLPVEASIDELPLMFGLLLVI